MVSGPGQKPRPELFCGVFSSRLHDAGTDTIADCRDGGPGAEERAVVIDEPAGSGVAEKRAHDLFCGGTLVAGVGTGGKIKKPEAEEEHPDDAGEPDVGSNLTGPRADDERAGDERDEKRECGDNDLRDVRRIDDIADEHHGAPDSNCDQGMPEKCENLMSKRFTAIVGFDFYSD